MTCKPNAAEAIERLRALYERRAPDRIFVAFHVPGGGALAEFAATHREGECPYPDPEERIAFWARMLAERPRIDDDSLPFVYLTEMDQGLYGALLGGDIRFNCNPANGWISSMVPPLLGRLSALGELSFSESHPWFGRYLAQLDAFVRGARGRFGICPFVMVSGVNFLFELVGATDAYLSLIDDPELCRVAMELGDRVNAAVQDAFFAHAPLTAGGILHHSCQWLPGRAVMESVDPFHMTSVGYLERWGLPGLERTFARYDGGQLHLHGNGRHLLEAVASLRKLTALVLGDDKGFPRAFDVLPELRARSGDLPLVVSVDFPRFVAALDSHRLTGGVLYLVGGAPNATVAATCMDRVRGYRC
jgi:hypothetical protein